MWLLGTLGAALLLLHSAKPTHAGFMQFLETETWLGKFTVHCPTQVLHHPGKYTDTELATWVLYWAHCHLTTGTAGNSRGDLSVGSSDREGGLKQ